MSIFVDFIASSLILLKLNKELLQRNFNSKIYNDLEFPPTQLLR